MHSARRLQTLVTNKLTSLHGTDSTKTGDNESKPLRRKKFTASR